MFDTVYEWLESWGFEWDEEDLEWVGGGGDEQVFGENAWVYCRQHVKPHLTGWCGVGCRDKIGLGICGQEHAQDAYEKCRDWELPIYGETSYEQLCKEKNKVKKG